MKRILLSTTIVLLASGAYAAPATQSQSNDFFFKPYVGADYDQVHVDYAHGNDDVLEDNLNGGDVHVGARIHKYLGFELGYLDTLKGKDSNVLGTGVDSKTNVKGGTFDALGYYPIYDKVELIGTVGVSVLTADAKLSAGGPSLNLNKTETKPRIGAGAQYWLTDNLNARAIVRYQDADFSDTVNNAIVSSIGINYQF